MTFEIQKLLDELVETTLLAEKWQMWAEHSLPDQAVYVPSIFSMRDAHSHITKAFGKAIEEKLFNAQNCEQEFFEKEYFKEHFKEALEHCARSFYDIADYIILEIKQYAEEIRNSDMRSISFLREKLLALNDEIIHIRQNKTAPQENMKKCDAILVAITTIYTNTDCLSQIQETHVKLKDVVYKIHRTFKEDVITKYKPDFFEKKDDDLNSIDIEQEKTLQSLLDLDTTESIENTIDFQREYSKTLKDMFEKATDLLREYETLCQKLKDHQSVSRPTRLKEMFKQILIFLSTLFATWFINTYILPAVATTVSATGQMINGQAINMNTLIKFVLIPVAIYFLIQVILYLVQRKR